MAYHAYVNNSRRITGVGEKNGRCKKITYTGGDAIIPLTFEMLAYWNRKRFVVGSSSVLKFR